MTSPLLPLQAGNDYRGTKAALWIFGVLMLLRTIMSVNSILNGRKILVTADGVPLDAFSPDAAKRIILLFALLALANLMMCIMSWVVLARYRSLVPLMLTLQLLQYAGARLIHLSLPTLRVGDPPAATINYILLTLMVTGLVLSLWQRPAKHPQPAG